MPREFLPQGRKREARGEARALPGAVRDRMMHRETVHDRRFTKQNLRRAAAAEPVTDPEHVAD